MTRVNTGKESLISLLTAFGPGVGDLRLEAKEMSLIGTVALPTHLLHTRVSADVEDPGEIIITDVARVMTFLRTLPKDSAVTLWQLQGDVLKINSGKTDLTMPTSNYLRSQAGVARATLKVEEATANHWKSFGGHALTCYARLEGKDLQKVASIEKVVGKDNIMKTEFSAEKALFSVSSGQRGATQMGVGLDLTDATGEVAKSNFGHWLPALLKCVPKGPVELHTTDDFVLVFRHVEKEFLLIVLDQRGGR